MDKRPAFMTLGDVAGVSGAGCLNTLILLVERAGVSSTFHSLPSDSSESFCVASRGKRVLSSSSSKNVCGSFSSCAGVDSRGCGALARASERFFSMSNASALFVYGSCPSLG